jgi:hypothetical protein
LRKLKDSKKGGIMKLIIFLIINLNIFMAHAATVFDRNNEIEIVFSADRTEQCEIGNKGTDGFSFELRNHADFVVVEGSVLNNYMENNISYTIDSSNRSFIFKKKSIQEVLNTIISNKDVLDIILFEMQLAFKSLRLKQDTNYPKALKIKDMFSNGCNRNTFLDQL